MNHPASLVEVLRWGPELSVGPHDEPTRVPGVDGAGDMRGRILVVEDDDRIANPLVRALTSQGYDVSRAETGERARELLISERPDLVLLDLGLPDVDGVDLCREIASRSPAPRILMLTARTDEIDVVVGLDAGAVDYIAKPFRLAELLARIRVHCRRSDDTDESATRTPSLDDGHAPPVVLDVDHASRRVTVRGVELELRAKEFDLLAELVAHSGKVVRREDLMARVWDEHWFGSTKTLDVHVAGLRRKLRDATGDGDAVRIDTLRGVGYRLEFGDRTC